MITNEKGIQEVTEMDLYLLWAMDDLMIKAMPFGEFAVRMKNNGVTVRDDVRKDLK